MKYCNIEIISFLICDMFITLIQIHTLNRNADGSLNYKSTHTEPVSSSVWRVAWNATGTVLSTSSEDGSLRMWRKDFAGNWRCVQELPFTNETKHFYNN